MMHMRAPMLSSHAEQEGWSGGCEVKRGGQDHVVMGRSPLMSNDEEMRKKAVSHVVEGIA